MNVGEQVTIVEQGNAFGRTGVITHTYEAHNCCGVRVLLDGGVEEFVHIWDPTRVGDDEVFKSLLPESRYYDFEWQNRKGVHI